MSKPIIQLNEESVKSELKELVRNSVEETLNELLNKEAEELTSAAKYERTEARQGYRSGRYSRKLTTTSGEVRLEVPKLKGVPFETAIIERYRRRESSVEEALIEMYLAGAYVYVDGIYLKRNWGGEFENVSILVAIGVDEDGYREIIGAAEGMKEDAESWKSFLVWLKERGLDGVKLIVGDKCLGMCNAVAEVFPEAKYQRCTVHFYRNVFSVTPRKHMREVTRMLKAIHAQESKEAARKKARDIVDKLRSMRLNEAANKVEDGIEETLTYMDFPSQHWMKIRTNNVIERMNREIRRRTRVVGTFPDGKSALMLVCARLRYVSGKEWGSKRYLCMKYLTEAATEVA